MKGKTPKTLLLFQFCFSTLSATSRLYLPWRLLISSQALKLKNKAAASLVGPCILAPPSMKMIIILTSRHAITRTTSVPMDTMKMRAMIQWLRTPLLGQATTSFHRAVSRIWGWTISRMEVLLSPSQRRNYRQPLLPPLQILIIALQSPSCPFFQPQIIRHRSWFLKWNQPIFVYVKHIESLFQFLFSIHSIIFEFGTTCITTIYSLFRLGLSPFPTPSSL